MRVKESPTRYTESVKALFAVKLLSCLYSIATRTATLIANGLAIVALPSYVPKILTAFTLAHSSYLSYA